MSETVTVYPPSTLDRYGKRSHSGSGTTYTCRVQDERKVTYDDTGKEVVQTGVIYLYGAPVINPASRVVLSDGSEPVLIGVDVVDDQDGPHHTVLMIGK